MNMQDNDNENQVDDSETNSELESVHNSNEAGPSSKSLSYQLKDNKKTASLPKKKKKHKHIAEAWKYFEQEGSFAVCQVEITKNGIKKKSGHKYDCTNTNSTSSMNYYVTQEHNIVLENLAKK
ncbi:26139_t:CDS:1, partial [Gigaspora margarita]